MKFSAIIKSFTHLTILRSRHKRTFHSVWQKQQETAALLKLHKKNQEVVPCRGEEQCCSGNSLTISSFEKDNSQSFICINTINMHDPQWANKVSRRRSGCFAPLAGQIASFFPAFPPTPAHFTYHLFHLGGSPSFSGVVWCDPSKSVPALLLRCCRVVVAAAVTSRQRRRRLNGDFSEANEMQRNWVASECVVTWAPFC